MLFRSVDYEIESKIRRSALNYLNIPINLENRHAPLLISSCLPLNCSSEENSIVGRFRPMRLENALGFLPVYDGPYRKGYKLWQSTRGFPTSFDIFGGDQNRTTVILGKMGSGKSVINNTLILEFRARFPEGIIIVIDKKTSYQKSSDLIGGKVVRFTKENFKKAPYSPFAVKDWKDEDIELVISFITTAISESNPKAQIMDEHTEVLSEALKICIKLQEEDQEYALKEGGEIHPHFIWKDVLEQLEAAAVNKGFKSTAPVDELRRWTTSFSKTGQLGFLFCEYEKEEKFSESLNFIVYDLEGISDPRLQTIAARLVGLKVSREVLRYPESIPKLIIFEELGVYLEGDSQETQEQANRLVCNITKTIRKKNGIPVGITNAVDDFFTKAGGKSFWQQSTQKIFLPFTSEMVGSLYERIEKKEIQGLGKADLDIIKSLHIKDGHYSQAYVMSDVADFKASVNLPLSPSMYALVNTSPLTNQRYMDLKKSGKTTLEALDIDAKEFAEKKRRKE